MDGAGDLNATAACPACGGTNPIVARFCLTCGSPLGDPAPLREVRKTITVLFTDVTGSTPLGEQLDPETLKVVMARYFDEMRAVVERHGGTVEKFIGDAVKAVFGDPVVHEDDALRACRAALEMRDTLARVNEELERDAGVRLTVRTGVNTGEVVAGAEHGGQRLLLGDAVNVGARFEQAAGPDEIIVGASTHGLVRNAVVVEEMEPLELKGKSGPLRAFRLLGLAVQKGRGMVEGRDLRSPLVGRASELARMSGAFHRAIEERRCLLCTVMGPPGVGKSRLSEELLVHLPDDTLAFQGRCLPYGQGITYWPVGEVLREAAGIDDRDGVEEARIKLAALADGGTGEPSGPALAHIVGQAMGLSEGSAEAEEIAWAVRKVLEKVARRRPLAIVLDDVQWGEPAFLDLIEHVADWSRDAPIFLLCLARLEILDVRPQWGAGSLTIPLEPLERDDSASLIRNFAGGTTIGRDLTERILAAAEGNPLFVEEILAMLVGDDVLKRTDRGWTSDRDLQELAIPPTITALLEARLDRLREDERSVLEGGSVVGQVFDLASLTELTPPLIRPRLFAQLTSLIRKQFIRPDASQSGGEETFAFRHLLMREAVYRSLPKRIRAELHRMFADWLERTAGDRLVECEEILAHHLDRAHAYLSELGPVPASQLALAARASLHLGNAGRRASVRGDVPLATSLLRRAAALANQDSRDRVELLLDEGEALMDGSSLREAKQVLDEAAASARTHGYPDLEMVAALHRARLRTQTEPASAAEAFRAAEAAVEFFRKGDDVRGLAQAWKLLVNCHLEQGQLAMAEAVGLEALAYLERHADPALLERYQRVFAGLLLSTGLYGPVSVDQAIERCERTRAAWPTNPALQAGSLCIEGHLRAMQGRFDEGRRLIALGRHSLKQIGRPIFAATGGGEALGELEMLAGDPDAAVNALREARDELVVLGQVTSAAMLGAELADALVAQGQLAEAEALTSDTERVADPGDATAQTVWRYVRARIWVRSGKEEDAVSLALRAVGMADETDDTNLRATARVALADVLQATGQGTEAREQLRRALSLYETKGNVAAAAKVRAALGLSAGAAT